MVFQAPKLRIIYLLISIFLLLINPCATQIFFNYTDFSQTIKNKTIIPTGNATISGSGIQLTPDEVDNWGRATYSKQMHLWDEKSGKVASFTSNFSFIIDSQGKDRYSDGITFFLSTPNFPAPRPTDGAGLGLVSRDQMGQPIFLAANKFVAVEFDTFQNVEFDLPNSVSEHVGININNMSSQVSTPWYCTIKENRTYSASINYDSSTQNLSVTFTGFSHDNTTIQQHLSLVINLTDHLPESVEFGFSASTGLISELHILSTWSSESTAPSTIQQSPAPSVEKNKDEPKTKLVVGLSLGACIFIIGLLLVCFVYRKKCREGKGEKEEEFGFDLSMDDVFERGIGPKKFSYNELVSATSNFAEENKLGQGGFGRVYKGYLKAINSYVAIKRVSGGSVQGIKEYISEVRIIGRLRHRNLVKLIGWCHEKDELLLIYEFMSNGSLDLHLFKGKSLLTWVERYNIARGLASALQYLHEEWEQCVLHRDIKSSNILLDSKLNTKLGDFGLARLVDHVKGSQTTALAGTWGYLAPECIMSGRASKETDVYSFGIVVLEIVCGRKPAEPNAKQDEIIMLEWLWELYGARDLLKAADPRLGGDFDQTQMEWLMVVGLWCAHPDYNARPSIRKAIHVLDFEVTLPILEPKLPLTAFLTLPSSASTSSTSKSENHDA
ncbi:L-type lectin-domain containing receptor kinase IX.1-like isoform X5 [Quercus robur]|uniref:L-type lectin-domain containing receptor kinase IX.1-like isoform X4 n=1 Tax=Quercus robur TaxID=38942 RepID=UPI002161BDFE|nr:L-type lectin-domain containing receptor kinase IX.1-like isoform X4 [Quercus robur]XP_050260656.1 L-type lectin-domain containing receptor kinase IX.1-like isoform X5 [Quercus robur]